MDHAKLAVTQKSPGRAITESSGRCEPVHLMRAIAETGVDLISAGALTHSAPSLDISLDLAPFPRASATSPKAGGDHLRARSASGGLRLADSPPPLKREETTYVTKRRRRFGELKMACPAIEGTRKSYSRRIMAEWSSLAKWPPFPPRGGGESASRRGYAPAIRNSDIHERSGQGVGSRRSYGAGADNGCRI